MYFKLIYINMCNFQSVISKAMSMGGFARSLIKGIVDDHAEELFVQKTVGELLFKGYDEPMIRELSEFQGEEIMPDNQFGFYYGVSYIHFTLRKKRSFQKCSHAVSQP